MLRNINARAATASTIDAQFIRHFAIIRITGAGGSMTRAAVAHRRAPDVGATKLDVDPLQFALEVLLNC